MPAPGLSFDADERVCYHSGEIGGRVRQGKSGQLLTAPETGVTGT